MMPKGKIKIAVWVGEAPRKAKILVEFTVITSHSPYIAIMVTPTLQFEGNHLHVSLFAEVPHTFWSGGS